jgi:DNA-binding NtrC family response regulator
MTEAAKALGTVLIVDDDAYIRDSLAAVLSRRGFWVHTAASAEEVLEEQALAGVDALVTDLKMPGQDGAELIRRVSRRRPGLPVLVLTAFGTVASAVECVRAGAVDYLLKPTDPEALVLALRRAIDEVGRRRELAYLRDRSGAGAGRREPLGVSAAWRQVLAMVEAAAPADTPVLLRGESGTGKGEVARLLHRKSARAEGPFVHVNCAAIPDELFESEFFGHRRGAFTGAVSDREGRFQVAHRGTLMLDEIDALPPRAQAKVLRVLEDGVFERVGESRPTHVDVRLVSATNTDLDAAIEAGRLRADLYYRINVLSIQIPPLRERPEDILLLARAFLDELASRHGRRLEGLDPATEAALLAYRWPGNVRELRNVVERGVLLEQGPRLTPASLPFAGGGDGGEAGGGEGAGSGDLDLRRSLQAAERRLLETALRRAGGVRRQAAALLGIDERNLAYYLKKHGLHRKEAP